MLVLAFSAEQDALQRLAKLAPGLSLCSSGILVLQWLVLLVWIKKRASALQKRLFQSYVYALGSVCVWVVLYMFQYRATLKSDGSEISAFCAYACKFPFPDILANLNTIFVVAAAAAIASAVSPILIVCVTLLYVALEVAGMFPGPGQVRGTATFVLSMASASYLAWACTHRLPSRVSFALASVSVIYALNQILVGSYFGDWDFVSRDAAFTGAMVMAPLKLAKGGLFLAFYCLVFDRKGSRLLWFVGISTFLSLAIVSRQVLKSTPLDWFSLDALVTFFKEHPVISVICGMGFLCAVFVGVASVNSLLGRVLPGEDQPPSPAKNAPPRKEQKVKNSVRRRRAKEQEGKGSKKNGKGIDADGMPDGGS